MTVCPSSSRSGAQDPVSANPARPDGAVQAPDLDGLAEDLRLGLDRAAEAHGLTAAAICGQWLRDGLERFEALRPAADRDGSGRCSLRTGPCSLGPVPLPVQQ
ncbi:MAG: hypothetical protein VKP63_02465 [Cyanobacteriota bacterium]|nr:hypothetical protein [Cyanobacteriota bacterium]